MKTIDINNSIDWNIAERNLQMSRFQPMYDKTFYQLIKNINSNPQYPADASEIRNRYLIEIDNWINSSSLNNISGLEDFTSRDVIIGVTHSIDDLHISFHQSIVILEKSYAYMKRMRPDITVRTLESLQEGDVLLFEAPFAHFGDLHPQTMQILEKCLALNIPVHIDAAWYGCLKDFEFNYAHPAIQSVSFSLSKGLGLGSHRTGIRYSRNRWPGPVTIINDFNMNLTSTMWIGMKFIEHFSIDFLQNKYGEAYELVCEKLDLKKTKAIHLAFKDCEGGSVPVGIRPLLRTLVDNINELK